MESYIQIDRQMFLISLLIWPYIVSINVTTTARESTKVNPTIYTDRYVLYLTKYYKQLLYISTYLPIQRKFSSYTLYLHTKMYSLSIYNMVGKMNPLFNVINQFRFFDQLVCAKGKKEYCVAANIQPHVNILFFSLYIKIRIFSNIPHQM